jgi:hypothetical protein
VDRGAVRLASPRKFLPYPPGRREIQIDTSPDRNPLFGSAPALSSHCLDLVRARERALLSCIDEQR